MYSTIIIPRVSETNGAGHISNTVVPVWFEAGRSEIYKLLTPDLSFENWKVALVNMNVDFIKQIFLQANVEVKTWIESIGNKSFTVYEEMDQNGQIYAKGTATYVYFNYKTQQSEVIPQEVRTKLEEHLHCEK
jgi:acyl-CoA thioester hydrolase